MDSTIATFLIQDGITNGAIYALLGLALVLVFAVTRIIFIPQGEFVAYGALSLALLDAGKVPGTAPMLIAFGVAAFVLDLWAMRRGGDAKSFIRSVLVNLALPVVIYALVTLVAPLQLPSIVRALLAIIIIAPMGYYIYRIVYRPLVDASVLVLLIASLGVHLFMMGLALIFFGPEGLRAEPLTDGSFLVGPMVVTTQSLWIYGITILIIIALYVFFEKTLLGKALRATAVNRLGARLVGVRTQLTGVTALVLAAIIGAVSGVLIAPVTTIYYDTGFLIGLKGFVAAILGGLGNFPLTAIAALGVGLVEAFSSFFASDYKEVIVFGLIIPVLVWLSFGAGHHEED